MTVEQASANSSSPLVDLETRNFADLTFFPGAELTIAAVAATSNIREIEIFINGESQGTQRVEKNYSVNYDIGSRGDLLVYAMATDNDGNRGVSIISPITAREPEPPKVILDFPISGQRFQNRFVLLWHQLISLKNQTILEFQGPTILSDGVPIVNHHYILGRARTHIKAFT